MAKKRKRSGRRNDEPTGPNLDVGPSRKRIRDFEDVADSDDEFHINQDKILLDDEPDVKRRRKIGEQQEFLQPSDEEVLDYDDEEEEEDVDEGYEQQYGQNEFDYASEGADNDAEDDEEGYKWGTSKADMYGVDEVETEEQAIAEEAEGSRLQKKQLWKNDLDYLDFDASEWQGGVAEENDAHVAAKDLKTEKTRQLHDRKDMRPAELLTSRYPEFKPLSEALLQMREIHPTLVEAAKSKDPRFTKSDFPNATTKLRAATAYLSALTMYFALLTSPAVGAQAEADSMSAHQLHDHPIMASIEQCQGLWQRAKDLPADPHPSAKGELIDVMEMNGDAIAVPEANGKQSRQERVSKKSRAQRHAEAVQVADEARKAERLKRTEADLANLDSLIAPAAKKASTQGRPAADDGADSDIGEEATLTTHEAAEKAKRKKSLRFYTSQIAQKANKRGTAGRNAGGDDDIPYRERLKDRQARLNAEAEKRGRKNADVGDELGGESDEEDHRQAQEIRAGGEDDDYYDLIAARTAKKKADKSSFAEAQRQAALQGGQVVQQETVGADGKRKITYAIEKNKGLTPHRKKEVRNPRVKKRKKYDEKKKKLASIKPVYKGGEGRGGYGGELTGIKTGLVKSTKL